MYWFTTGNQQVRTEATRHTTKAEPEPTKTYQLNRKYQIHRTNKFTAGLAVDVFASLASYYSQAVDDLVRKSEGHTCISK